ncbi:MAG TPA: DedA family protein [Gemmatimonadaceae bacterium]|jgi:membrane-associated protein|nr:DedA family protein [Gemmatimonadaceae bacterium]
MDALLALVDFILHVDVHLASIVQQYGAWTYGVLTAIIFCETGLVVTPFLPGDSLLFATGALAATTVLDVWVLFPLLTVAAIVGDAVNYWTGSRFGTKLFDGRIPYLKQAHLDRTHAFYEKYGGKAIVIARFVPIVRTVAPFVAGCGRMTYARFALYNVLGACLWIGSMLFGGYLFGNIPIVRENFGIVVIVIIVASLVPVVVEFLRPRVASASGSGD